MHHQEEKKHNPFSSILKKTGSVLKISKQRSSSLLYPSVIDRFTLEVPYCRKFFKWQVILNMETPDVPPDFIFSKNEEVSVMLAQVGAMKNWNYKSENSLLDIVNDILSILREQQREMARTFPVERIQFECSTIEGIPGVEFFVEKLDDYGHSEVRCLIPLGVDIKKIQSKDAKVEKGHLYVSFQADNPYKSPDTAFVLPPSWTEYFGSMTPPQWTSDMCLVEYIPKTEELVNEYVNNFFLRKSLLDQFIILFGDPLEYDSQYLRRISFFFDDKTNTPFLLYINIEKYPKEKPTVSISSSQVCKQTLISRGLGNIPWSPRWPPEELAKRLKNFLADVIAAEWKNIVLSEMSEKGFP